MGDLVFIHRQLGREQVPARAAQRKVGLTTWRLRAGLDPYGRGGRGNRPTSHPFHLDSDREVRPPPPLVARVRHDPPPGRSAGLGLRRMRSSGYGMTSG